MADPLQPSDNVTPTEFFETLLPQGFAAQADAGNAPQDFTIQFCVTGAGGGDWYAAIANGAMSVEPGTREANLRLTLGIDDWRDAVLGRNGATLALLLPQSRPGRPDNSGRAKAVKGTMALELSRPERDPFRLELCFNNSAAPKTTLRVALSDYVAMQEGTANGQQLFMQGRIRVEGDMALLMQVAALTM